MRTLNRATPQRADGHVVAEMFSLVSTIQFEPQPILLDVKAVPAGDRAVCQRLQAHDPEFGKLFRVVIGTRRETRLAGRCMPGACSLC